MCLKTRIRYAEEPGLTRIQTDRHIPVGIHDGGGVAVEPVERPVDRNGIDGAILLTDRTEIVIHPSTERWLA